MRLFKFRRDPTDPVDRVDRFWHGRRLRLVAGLSVSDDFSSVRGVVVRAKGEGKYLRLEPISASQSALRQELAISCLSLCAAGGSTTEFESLKNDLASIQAELLNRLRSECGSAAESLLAVCVGDPGLWSRDFDGKQQYASFCNPDMLSALSGVSVIDALPAKDLVAGGHGWPLTPLACWLVAADRTSPVAIHARLVVHVDRDLEIFYLPVSDGLDDEYPPIRYGRVTHLDCGSAQRRDGGRSPERNEDFSQSNGRIVEELLAAWSEVVEQNACPANPANREADLAKRTKLVAEAFGISSTDIDATAQHWALRQLKSVVADCAIDPGRPLQVFLAGENRMRMPLRGALQGMFPDVSIDTVETLGITADSLSAVLVAALGAMHVDQMPGNLPWLTGVASPRILGRLTPGSPKQWRMLLREMADYHPAAMRLRDAV